MSSNTPKFSGLKRGQAAAKAAAADVALGVDRTAASATVAPPEQVQEQKKRGGRPPVAPEQRHVRVGITMPPGEIAKMEQILERQRARGSAITTVAMVLRAGLAALSQLSDEEIQLLSAGLISG